MKKIQLSIPEPCHENWDNMAPTQQGRYCNACAKEVIDFSNMSDSEVLNYFLKKKHTDKVCGNAYPDQLDRLIAAPPKKKFYWFLQYLLAFVLFIGKGNSSKAQASQGMMRPKPGRVTAMPVSTNTNPGKIMINGIIKDEKGQPVPYATLKIKGSNIGTSAKENGSFSLPVDSTNTVVVSALGYTTKEISVHDFADKEIALAKDNQLMKEVVITTNTDTRRRGGAMVCVVRTRSIKSNVTNWLKPFDSPLKIYPNPIQRGNMFTISMKLKQTGSYAIQITDAMGRLLSEKKINALSKDWNEKIESNNNWAAGVYYVKVVDDKGKLFKTVSVAIQ